MVYGAIDLHLRTSRIRIIDGEGRVLRDGGVATTADRLVAAFASPGPMRIVIESGTESEWVAQALEAAGHEVVVVDPNFAPTYGDAQRKVKTDKRDVAALAEANRRGWYRPAYRVSAAQRERRQVLRSRRQLVQMRSGTISLVRSLLRQCGYRLGSGRSERVPERLAGLTLPAALRETLTPLRRVLETVTAEIALIDARLLQHARQDAVVQRLQSVPGVGPVVALSFRAFVDDVSRFADAGRVSAALGLVPWEQSSAERQHRGHISKVGPRELRSLFVQAAWVHWRVARHSPLGEWTTQLAARRGKRIAVVALARRLSRILFALWRDDTTFRSVRRAA